jgi:hypothetical protein
LSGQRVVRALIYTTLAPAAYCPDPFYVAALTPAGCNAHLLLASPLLLTLFCPCPRTCPTVIRGEQGAQVCCVESCPEVPTKQRNSVEVL